MFSVVDNIPIFGDPHDEAAIRQIKNCAKDASFCALMADHHLGYAVPIGGVVGYEDKISPSGVGYDIACGNKAVRLDIPGSEVKSNVRTIMDDVWKSISFGVGRINNEKVEHPIFDRDVNAWKIG